MSSLTKEQLLRIEENRKKALERKAAAAVSTAQIAPKVTSSSFYGAGSKKPLDIKVVPSSAAPAAKKFKSEPGKPQYAYQQSDSSEVKRTPANTGLCKIISRDRFAVNMGYNQQTIEIFKKLPSKLYGIDQKI